MAQLMTGTAPDSRVNGESISDSFDRAGVAHLSFEVCIIEKPIER